MYYKGEGVPQDYKEAVKWWRKAAEQGDAEAQSNLGEMYYKGEGVPQDYKEAIKWFRKAAEQGHTWAQYNLTKLEAKNEAIIKNIEEEKRKKARQTQAEQESMPSNISIIDLKHMPDTDDIGNEYLYNNYYRNFIISGYVYYYNDNPHVSTFDLCEGKFPQKGVCIEGIEFFQSIDKMSQETRRSLTRHGRSGDLFATIAVERPWHRPNRAVKIILQTK